MTVKRIKEEEEKMNKSGEYCKIAPKKDLAVFSRMHLLIAGRVASTFLVINNGIPMYSAKQIRGLYALSQTGGCLRVNELL